MITSRQNPRVQQLRTLLRQPDRSAGLFVVEGVRLAEEAARAGWQPTEVYHSTALNARGQQVLSSFTQTGVFTEQLDPGLMEYVSGTETSQGLLAVFPRRELPLPSHLDFILALDALRDPGNLGTLLRTAGAAGVQAVLAMPGTAEPFSPKVLRAGMGAHFRLPIFSRQWSELGTLPIEGPSPRVLVADAETGQPCWQVDLRAPLILVVSSEAEGATPAARAAATGWVRIPMPGSTESLNAAAAGAILLFEVVRQRS